MLPLGVVVQETLCSSVCTNLDICSIVEHAVKVCIVFVGTGPQCKKTNFFFFLERWRKIRTNIRQAIIKCSSISTSNYQDIKGNITITWHQVHVFKSIGCYEPNVIALFDTTSYQCFILLATECVQYSENTGKRVWERSLKWCNRVVWISVPDGTFASADPLLTRAPKNVHDILGVACNEIIISSGT